MFSQWLTINRSESPLSAQGLQAIGATCRRMGVVLAVRIVVCGVITGTDMEGHSQTWVALRSADIRRTS